MQRTTYYCDICKNEADGLTLIPLTLPCRDYDDPNCSPDGFYRMSEVEIKEVCPDCRDRYADLIWTSFAEISRQEYDRDPEIKYIEPNKEGL